LFQQFLEIKNFTPSSSKMLYLLSDAFTWATPGSDTTSYLKFFEIFFIMTQLSCFKQIFAS